MDTYRVKVGTNGEIVLPPVLRDMLGLVVGDSIELCVDAEGKLIVRTAERSVGPLSDFFEDLILGDLRREGCSGDLLKSKFLERKLKLSTVLDRLAEEANSSHKHAKAIQWRETRELELLKIGKVSLGAYKVMLTARSVRDIIVLPEEVIKELPTVLEELEQDPTEFKRLRGPYYETYRVSFNCGAKDFRVIYSVFTPQNLVVILTVGERKVIYERLNGIG